MELMKFIAVLLLITVTGIRATKDQNAEGTDATNLQNFNPLESLVLNQNGSKSTKDLVRVKRQYYPNPYYDRGPYYPIPIPIFLGGFGGFGGGGFGGRGFGGRGFGGRGFGGRGFGGRGFGGLGGRGGGFGGRGGGIGGGGRGGGRG